MWGQGSLQIGFLRLTAGGGKGGPGRVSSARQGQCHGEGTGFSLEHIMEWVLLTGARGSGTGLS